MDFNQKQIDELEEKLKNTIESENINENRQIKIQNVKFIGRIPVENKANGQIRFENVFIVDKEIIETDNGKEIRSTEQSSIYLGDKCIAGKIGDMDYIYNPKFEEENQELENSINELVKNDLEKEEKDENEKIQENEEEIIKEQENQEDLTQENTKQKDKDEEQKEPEKISKKQEKNIEIKSIQEVDLETVVDGTDTLAKRLDLPEYSKLYVIYSDNVKDVMHENERNNTTFSLVGVTKDGKAKVLNDEFEIDRTAGINGEKTQTKIKADGEATRDDKDLSVYKRKTNGIDIGCERDIDSVNVFMYQKTLEKNENVGIQVETSKTPVIKLETKEVMDRYKGMYQADNIQNEIQEHTDANCNPKDVKDYDGDDTTETHEHVGDIVVKDSDIEGTSDEGIYIQENQDNEIDIDEKTNEILNYENKYGEQEIKGQFTYDEVKEELEKQIENNEKNKSGKTIEQIVEEVKENMDYDAQMLDRSKKRI